jgi:hypothetical protein
MLLLILLLNLSIITSLYLTSSQYKMINNLILNSKLTIYQRNKINLILFRSYENYAIKQAKIFKKKHFYKCKNININDLIICSKVGLYKSIKRYNGKNTILIFSYIYIKSEMLKLLTNYYSSSIIPRKIRIKNKKNFTLNELEFYNKNINICKIYYLDKILFNDIYYSENNNNILTNINNNEIYEHIWQKINNMDSTIKRIVHLKYDFYFNIIRNNKDIAELMSLSEETIRKKLNYIN